MTDIFFFVQFSLSFIVLPVVRPLCCSDALKSDRILEVNYKTCKEEKLLVLPNDIVLRVLKYI